MTPTEYATWKAYYAESPFEPWLRTAMMCATVANFAGKVLKEGHHMTPADFLPGDPPEPDPVEYFRSLHG